MALIHLRKLRSFLVLILAVLLPVAGAMWALASSSFVLMVAISIALMSGLVLFVEEAMSTSIDNELERLYALVEKQRFELGDLNESVREENRIIGLLEERNTSLAAEVVARSIHNDAA